MISVRLCLLLIPALLAAACNKAPAPETAKPASERIATVDGKPISRSEFDLYVSTVEEQSGRQITDAEKNQTLDQLIAMKLAEAAAEKEAADKEPKVADQLAQARMNVLVEAHLEDFLEKNPVTEADLQSEYDQESAKLPREYHARHILVDDQAAAVAITKQLEGGADFAKLATQKSKDGSSKSGGDLGWFTLDSMVKPFSDAVAALQPGQITSAPVQSEFGWHVIKLEETRATPMPAFEEIKDRVRVYVQRKRIQDYLDGLRKNAKIEKKI
jgi:peptidyl-prolyl cis-trans isomerase C